MPPSDDAAAQRELNATLERFRGDPRVALGLRPTDDAAAARRAFMALCKVYHPAKFARFAPATVRLSNEVFLAIRRAYESLSTAPAPPARVPTAPTTPPERPSGGIARIVKFTPPTGVPVQAAPPPPPAQPPTPVRPSPQERPSGTTIPRPATPRPSTPSPAPPPAAPVPPARRSTPTPGREMRDAQLDRALDLAQAQKWPEARVAFVELATRHPGDPRYRAYVHYARGWEAFTLGRDAEARAEWQRALACDPRNDLVKWALESTGVVK